MFFQNDQSWYKRYEKSNQIAKIFLFVLLVSWLRQRAFQGIIHNCLILHLKSNIVCSFSKISFNIGDLLNIFINFGLIPIILFNIRSRTSTGPLGTTTSLGTRPTWGTSRPPSSRTGSRCCPSPRIRRSRPRTWEVWMEVKVLVRNKVGVSTIFHLINNCTRKDPELASVQLN